MALVSLQIHDGECSDVEQGVMCVCPVQMYIT